jgi:hypothetical protein
MMTKDEIEAAENRGETIYKDNGDGFYAREYPDFQTCNICHTRQPIADLKCMCSPPVYWCKRCTLEREAKEFPQSTLKVTV